MNKDLKILQDENKGLVLRAITSNDLEDLRIWKNVNRHVFFYQDVIETEQQKAWFQSYLKEPFNFMFVIDYNGSAIGCIGFRLNSGVADIYNVILGKEEYKGKGLMSLGLRMIISYAIDVYASEITVKVLKSNIIGQGFYLKNSFKVSHEADNYILMKLPIKGFQRVKVKYNET